MAELDYMNKQRTQELIDEIKRRLALKQDVIQYAEMPEASADLAGKVVQYIGFGNVYTHGAYYHIITEQSAGSDPTYAWKKVIYSKEDIDALIAAAGHFEAVDALPTTDIKTNVIYLVPKTETLSGYTATDNTFYVPTGTDDDPAYDHYDEDGNKLTDTVDADAVKAAIDAGTYTAGTKAVKVGDPRNTKDEYINLDGTVNGWEYIGSTDIDLKDYVKKSDMVPITSAELAAMWED